MPRRSNAKNPCTQQDNFEADGGPVMNDDPIRTEAKAEIIDANYITPTKEADKTAAINNEPLPKRYIIINTYRDI